MNLFSLPPCPLAEWHLDVPGPPAWMYVVFVLVAVFKMASSAGNRKQTSPAIRLPPSPPPPTPALYAPAKTICLVGRTSAGKSSLANALTGTQAFIVGVEHGTTTGFQTVPYRGGYQLQDTPGLLDGDHYSTRVLEAAKHGELVIFLTTGQLYRQEVDFLRELCSMQATWNRTRKPAEPTRSVLVFLNACDLKERTMPSAARANELAALKTQVAPWLESTTVLSGAAAPVDGGPPWIASLEGYLAHFCCQGVIHPAA